jgi:hypothetical protein
MWTVQDERGEMTGACSDDTAKREKGCQDMNGAVAKLKDKR